MATRAQQRRPPATTTAGKTARSVLHKLVSNHRKLWFAVIAGVVAFFVTPAAWPFLTRTLTAWNVVVLLLLPLTYFWMKRLDAGQLRARYEENDPTAPVILLVAVVAALLSMLAIVAMLANLKQGDAAERLRHIILATLTIVDSWMLVPSLFTLHYADEFYSVEPEKAPLTFPQTEDPLFWDFVYFSFTIAAACQTADVRTNTERIRKAVLAQTIVAFLFNLAVLGFAINVTAGIISGE
jgi:uncharacterized membrane protein